GFDDEERYADIYGLHLIYQYSCAQEDNFYDPAAFIQSYAIPERMIKEAYKMFEARSEEHTSELQSRFDLVCRLLLEKKKQYRFTDESREVTAFDSDSAYRHVAKQESYGTREATTEAKRQGSQYYKPTFQQQAGTWGD